jgi:hypothetical protein
MRREAPDESVRRDLPRLTARGLAARPLPGMRGYRGGFVGEAHLASGLNRLHMVNDPLCLGSGSRVRAVGPTT